MIMKTEWIICPSGRENTQYDTDGYGSFLLLDKDDKPKVALHIEMKCVGQWRNTRSCTRINHCPILRPCVPPYILYQHGKCGHGYQEPAICNGTFWCGRYIECLHSCQLWPCCGANGENHWFEQATRKTHCLQMCLTSAEFNAGESCV